MSLGQTTSAPASAWLDGRAREQVERGVVHDLAVLDEPAVAVVGVLAEAHVRHEHEVGHAGAKRAQAPAGRSRRRRRRPSRRRPSPPGSRRGAPRGCRAPWTRAASATSSSTERRAIPARPGSGSTTPSPGQTNSGIHEARRVEPAFSRTSARSAPVRRKRRRRVTGKVATRKGYASRAPERRPAAVARLDGPNRPSERPGGTVDSRPFDHEHDGTRSAGARATGPYTWDWPATEGALALDWEEPPPPEPSAGRHLMPVPGSGTVPRMASSPAGGLAARAALRERERTKVRRTRQLAALVALAAVALIVLLLTAFSPGGADPIGEAGPAPAQRLLPSGPPQPLVIAAQDTLQIKLPINQGRVTAIGYHASGPDAPSRSSRSARRRTRGSSAGSGSGSSATTARASATTSSRAASARGRAGSTWARRSARTSTRRSTGR